MNRVAVHYSRFAVSAAKLTLTLSIVQIPARESRPFYPLPLPVRLQDASKYDIGRSKRSGVKSSRKYVKKKRKKEKKEKKNGVLIQSARNDVKGGA